MGDRIKTNTEYQIALDLLDFMKDARPGTPEHVKLMEITARIEEYEEEHLGAGRFG